MPKFRVKLEDEIEAKDEEEARKLFWEMAIGCETEPSVLDVEEVDATL